MDQPEEWRPVSGPPSGCEGRYEVSSTGKVRSLLRMSSSGVRVLKATRNMETGYLQVCLQTTHGQKTCTVHRLVAWAFYGPRPADLQTRHLDGNQLNNAVSNLAYGTRSENMLDQVRHGTHASTKKTECPRRHPYTEGNTIRLKGERRRCKTCHREDFNRRTVQRRAKGLTSRGHPRIYSEDRAMGATGGSCRRAGGP